MCGLSADINQHCSTVVSTRASSRQYVTVPSPVSGPLTAWTASTWVGSPVGTRPGSVPAGPPSQLTWPWPSISSSLTLSPLPAFDPPSSHPVPPILSKISSDHQVSLGDSLMASCFLQQQCEGRGMAMQTPPKAALAAAWCLRTGFLHPHCTWPLEFCRPSAQLFTLQVFACARSQPGSQLLQKPVSDFPSPTAQQLPAPAPAPALRWHTVCPGVLLPPGWVAGGRAEGGASRSFLQSHVGVIKGRGS